MSPVATRIPRNQDSSNMELKFHITISRTSSAEEGGKPFTIYGVRVGTADSSWLLPRRYREFHSLHQELCRMLKSDQVPDLPPKRAFGNMDASFVESRAVLLQAYANGLVGSALARHQRVADFFQLFDLRRAAHTNDIPLLKACIAEGKNVDELDASGCSPLHYAAFSGHSEAVRLLVEAGASVHAKDRYGCTPAILASALSQPTSQQQTLSSLLGEIAPASPTLGPNVTPRVVLHNIPRNYMKLDSPRRLTAIIDPLSAGSKAMHVFETEVNPLFRLARIHVTFLECKSRNQAQFVAENIHLTTCDGILCVGGDHVIHFVLNGLMSRRDSEEAMRLPIGLLPIGVQSAMAASLGIHNLRDATERIITGTVHPVDVAKVTQATNEYYCCFGVGWGNTIQDEWKTQARLKPCKARVSFLPNSSARMCSCGNECKTCHARRSRFIEAPFSPQSPNVVSQGMVEEAKEIDTNDKWEVLEDEFVYFKISNLSCDMNSASKMTPFAHMSDGCFDLVTARNCNRMQFVESLKHLQEGKEYDKEMLQYRKIKALFIEPLCNDAAFSCDGVVASNLPVKLEVHRGVMTVYM